jgi:hypothetical protein
MRHVRDLTRARFDLVEDRARVKQRIEKLLEDALIKISSVLTDIHGVCGRAMIEALIAGQRSPTALTELAKGRARVRRDDLHEALQGRFTDHHARLARMLLDQLDDLTARITALTALLDAAIAALPAGSPRTDPATSTNAHDLAEGEGTPRPGPTPTSYASGIARLCAIPGAGPDSVRAVIARDRPGHDGVRSPPTTVLMGQGLPRAPCSPAARKAEPGPARATPTSKPRSPRWPPAPRKPTPSSASATDGWSNRCPRPRHWSRCNGPS